MILPGHVASAWLAARGLRTDLGGAMAAAMFPDLMDKPLRWVFRVTPNDRLPAHTLLGWGLTTAVVGALWGRRRAAGWATGYGAHLLGDQANAFLNPGRLYLGWPLVRYAMHTGPTGLGSSLRDFGRRSLALEALVTAVGLYAVWRAYGRRARVRSAGAEEER